MKRFYEEPELTMVKVVFGDIMNQQRPSIGEDQGSDGEEFESEL